jgi:uncharacterized membrane protein YphA (DoxX/SURF4 family)
VSQAKTGPAASQRTSPLALRAVHAIIFFGFGAAAIAGMLTELRQLAEGLFHPWHCGTPPAPFGTAAALIAGLLCVALVVFLVVGRSAPLWMSGLMLLCLVGSILSQDFPVARRSPPGANLKMLEVGKALHGAMREQLQRMLRVPASKADWTLALQKVAAEDNGLSPYRARFFSAVPWSVELLPREGEFLADAPPGTFQVYVPEDASRFSVTLLGLDAEHQVVRLRDDQGEVFELKGVFSPDTLQ